MSSKRPRPFDLHVGVPGLEHAPEFAKALGMISAEWANYERCMTSALSVMLEAKDQRAAVIMGGIANHRGKRELLRAMSRFLAEDSDRDALLKLLAAGKKLADSRNKYAHQAFMYGHNRKGQLGVFLVERPEEINGQRPVKLQELLSLHQRLKKGSTDLLKWVISEPKML